MVIAKKDGTAAYLEVSHKPGSVQLHRYPYLVYAPEQHGDFIATEDKGIPVVKLAAAAADGRTHDDIAAEFGTTADHVKDAVRYVEDHPE